MKLYAMLVLVILLLVGCTSPQAEEKTEPELFELNSYVVAQPNGNVQIQENSDTTEFTIRMVDQGFSPDTITVSKGERVGLFITNARELSTFSIIGYPVEDFVHTGNTIYIEFVADKIGEFEFGDERSSTRKGLLRVV